MQAGPNEDPDAWARIAVATSAGDETIDHFDAFGPTLAERPHMRVYRADSGLWEAVLAKCRRHKGHGVSGIVLLSRAARECMR